MVNLNSYEQRVNRYGGSEEKRTYYKNGKFYYKVIFVDEVLKNISFFV